MTTYGIDRSVAAGGTGGSTTALLADGSQPLTADWDAGNFSITALSFIASGANPTFELIRALDTQANAIEFQEADGSVRWKLNHAGTGSNNDFSLQRFNASGVLQDSPISVSGTSGLVTIPALTVTGDLLFGGIATANTFIRRNSGNTAWEAKTPQQVADELQPLLPFYPRNRIHNPMFIVDQRGNTSAGVMGASSRFAGDRWDTVKSGALTYTSRSTGAALSAANIPFRAAAELVCTAGASVAAGDYAILRQNMEGLDVADLMWGSASAKAVTLSFYVYSNKTGTLGGAISNGALNRSYPFTVTINATNTWERKTVTIPGDTSGTWATDSTTGLRVVFTPVAGSTFLGTAGAWASAALVGATGQTQWNSTSDTIYISGVQLEEGSVASSFWAPDYATELARCMRYYERGDTSTNSSGLSFEFNINDTSRFALVWAPYKARKRTNATPSLANVTWGVNTNVAATYPQLQSNSVEGFTVLCQSAASGRCYAYTNAGYWEVSADLP